MNVVRRVLASSSTIYNACAGAPQKINLEGVCRVLFIVRIFPTPCLDGPRHTTFNTQHQASLIPLLGNMSSFSASTSSSSPAAPSSRASPTKQNKTAAQVRPHIPLVRPATFVVTSAHCTLIDGPRVFSTQHTPLHSQTVKVMAIEEEAEGAEDAEAEEDTDAPSNQPLPVLVPTRPPLCVVDLHLAPHPTSL